jgi:hypothetical protein
MIPLLQTIKNLIVFAQSSAIYVCDFTRALNLCIMDIHDLYRDSSKAFQYDAFSCFNAIWELFHEQLRMHWFMDLNNGSEHLVFEGHYGTKAGAHLTPKIPCDFWTKLGSFGHSWRNSFPQKFKCKK